MLVVVIRGLVLNNYLGFDKFTEVVVVEVLGVGNLAGD